MCRLLETRSAFAVFLPNFAHFFVFAFAVLAVLAVGRLDAAAATGFVGTAPVHDPHGAQPLFGMFAAGAYPWRLGHAADAVVADAFSFGELFAPFADFPIILKPLRFAERRLPQQGEFEIGLRVFGGEKIVKALEISVGER